MAQRSIGQEQFGFAGRERATSSLEALASLIDWSQIAALLDPLYPATKGEPPWPPLVIFRALLLSIWYNLSDVKLAEALDDRASFRRFCGFSANEATPERTAFVRFRKLLVAHQLDRPLFEVVTTQLKAKAVTVKTGTSVDATIIASASEGDDDARWVKHKGTRAVHGFKAHIGADADTALAEELSVTSANINDGKAGPEALPDNLGEVFADSATSAMRSGQRAVCPALSPPACGGRDEAETLRKLHEWNQPIHRVRGQIEKIFATWKRCYGLRRMRWRGLAKAAVQVHLTAVAYNLKRTMTFSPQQNENQYHPAQDRGPSKPDPGNVP